MVKDFILKQIKHSKLSKARKQELAKEVPDIKLSKTQEWGLKTALSSHKKLLGEQVKLIYSEVGEPITYNCPRYTGTIVSLSIKDEMPFVSIEWTDGEAIPVWLFQIEFLKENIELSPEERKAIIEKKLLTKMKKNAETEKAMLKRELRDIRTHIVAYTEAIENQKKNAETAETKLKRSKNYNFTSEYIEKEFELVRKLVTIQEIYISDKGNIVALTKNLPAIGTMFPKSTKLGRFVILIDYTEKRVRINNRDWGIDGLARGHPHLNDDDTCWGSHGRGIKTMFETGQIFSLIDFIITFYTTYPQEYGSPHMDYERWIAERKRVKNDVLVESKI